jgi:hypothetical protein
VFRQTWLTSLGGLMVLVGIGIFIHGCFGNYDEVSIGISVVSLGLVTASSASTRLASRRTKNLLDQ